MTIHCFYHSADLDGHCSGAIVKHFIPETILHPINYGDEFPWDDVKPEDTVYMVDFCLQPSTDMDRLCGLCDVIWIDHHKTAIDSMAHRKITGYQEIGRAACELTWLWFREIGGVTESKPTPVAVTLLGRYDVWDHSDPRTLPFQYRMRMEDLDPLKGQDAMVLWAGMFDRVDEEAFIIDRVSEGELLLRYADQGNTKYCRAYAFETELITKCSVCQKHLAMPCDSKHEHFSAVCVNRGMTNSKVFDSVYNPEKHHLMITFCRLPLHKQAKGGWTVSLYSTRDDVNCGAIAKAFGGGGHKGAAGFQCDQLPFNI